MEELIKQQRFMTMAIIRCMGMLADNIYMISVGRQAEYTLSDFDSVADSLKNE